MRPAVAGRQRGDERAADGPGAGVVAVTTSERSVTDGPERDRVGLAFRVAWLVLGAALLVVLATDAWPAGRAWRLGVVVVLVVGGWVLAAARSRATVLPAVLLGTLGVVTGGVVGVLLPRAEGLTVRSAVGLVCLVAGVAALTSSRRLLSRGWRRPATAGAVAGVLISVLLVGFVIAPAVLATTVPHHPRDAETPGGRGLAYRDVTLHAADGTELRGWYVPSSNGAAVVLLHGTSSSVTGVLDHLEVLARAGYGVLAMDGRGAGLSSGHAMDFGWYSDGDVTTAVDYLVGTPGIDPAKIALVGISMGGMASIGAAGADPRVRAVVAEGVTRRSALDLAWLPERDGLRGTAALALTWAQNGVTALLSGGGPPAALSADVARAPDTSFLLLTATVATEQHSAEHIRSASPANVAVVPLPTRAHARGLADAPALWSRTVIGFLSEALAVPAGR